MKKFLSILLTTVICSSMLCSGCVVENNNESVPSELITDVETSYNDGEVEFVHSQNPSIVESNEPSDCPLSQAEINKVIENAESVLEANNYSGTALIAVGNTIIFEKSYGKIDGRGSGDNTNSTFYQIGSVTKQFTGTAILMLEKQGRIKTSDTLDKYFDGDDYLKKITIAQLLEMTAGMGDYMQTIEGDEELLKKYAEAAKKSDDDAKKFIVDVILSEGIYTDPGKVYSYSNSSFYLLGIIIEKVTGMEYRDFLQQYFFDTAGMTDTYFVGDGRDNQTGYSPAQEKYISDKDDKYLTAEGDYPYLYSAGSVVSTAEDVNKWLDTLLSGNLIGESDFKKIEKSLYEYNYGWFTSYDCLYHSGRTYAYSSQIFMDRKTGVKVILLTNISFYDNLKDMAKSIFDPLTEQVAKKNKR